MGRWAQRKRAGGGPPIANSLIEIATAQKTGANTAELTYSAPVTDTDFDVTAFQTLPSFAQGIGVSQISATTLQFTFDNAVGPETDVQYNGTTTGVLTPQTIAFT